MKKTNGDYKYSQSYIDKLFSLTKQVFFYSVDNEIINLEQNPFKTKTKIKRPKSRKETKESNCFRY